MRPDATCAGIAGMDCGVLPWAAGSACVRRRNASMQRQYLNLWLNHEAHVTCMLGIEWKGRRITMLLLLLMKVLLHLRNWHTPLSL
jgi:hypothetical protein